MLRRVLPIVVALAAGCGREQLAPVEGGLVVSVETLEFPPAWVGYPVSARLEVLNTGRVRRSAALRLSPPFSAAEGVEVEGGSAAVLEVVFAPERGGEFAAALELASEGQVLTVGLRGTAQAPPECGASAACRASRFDPQVGGCVEEVLPDDTACKLESACIEDARCRAGQCRGVERSCDDANACTTDACEAAAGCLHVPVVCPAPSDPCKVAACDAASGCAIADAPDGTACGPADCITAQVCLAGACTAVAVPDGFTCAAATPCQAKGTCQAQQCVQPAPAPLSPAWSYPVPQDRTLVFNGLSDAAGNLYWAECPAASPCELVSATRDGFLRFKVAASGRHGDRWGPGVLAIVGGNVISALGWDGIEARRTSDGSLAWKTDLLPALQALLGGGLWDGAGAGAIVDDGRGNVVVLTAPLRAGVGDPLGGLGVFLASLSASTGAVQWVVRANADLLALVGDEQGNLFASGARPDGGAGQWELFLASWSSAGAERWRVPSSGWVTALSVAGGRLIESEGAPGTVRLTASGASAAGADGGFGAALATTEAVLDGTLGYQFFQPPYTCCPMCSCPAVVPQLRLRSFAPASATVLWDAPVDPTGFPSSSPPLVSEVLLTSRGEALYARSPNDLYAVSVGEERLEAVSPAGALRFSCQLPGPGSFDAIAYTGAAALLTDRWVVAAQPQCYGCLRNPSPRLEAYDVPGYSLAAKGWVAQRGNAQRSGRPR